MRKMYLVAQMSDGRWYAYKEDWPRLPLRGSVGSKKHALNYAADKMGLTLEQYVKLKVRENK